MKQLYLVLVVILVCFQSSTAFSYDSNFAMIPSETVENCAPADQDAKALDISDYELITETDTDIRINGSFKFLRDMTNSSVHVYIEKFIRNQWHNEIYDADRPNFCKAWQDKNEVWYVKSKKLKGCPLGAGVRINAGCSRLSLKFV
jgi:hypothetical protein